MFSAFLFIVRISKPRKIFVNCIKDTILGRKKVYNLDNIGLNNGTNNEIPISNLDERNLNRIRLSNFAIQPTDLETEERSQAVLDDARPDASDLEVSEVPTENKIEAENPVLSLTTTNENNETAL